jgi:PadR family transcriptional regulator, regulatory protein AphA
MLGDPQQVAQLVPPLLAQPRAGQRSRPTCSGSRVASSARLGLLAEEREHTGRRRRSYRITAEGRAALAAWLAEPTDEPPQFRSLGLLKLFFSQHAEPEDVAELARSQVALHRHHLEVTAGIIERLQARGDRPGQLAVAEIMADAFRAMAGHWERIEAAADASPGRVGAARGS